MNGLIKNLREYLPLGDGSLWSRATRDIQKAADALEAQQAEIATLKTDLETERLRLAACGVAALGYFDGCKDEYRSASLEDTLRLYADKQALAEQVKVLRILTARASKQIMAWAEKYGEHLPEWLPPAGDVPLLEDIADVLAKADRAIEQLRKERQVTPEQMNAPMVAALATGDGK